MGRSSISPLRSSAATSQEVHRVIFPCVYLYVIVLQGFFLFLPPGEGEEILKVSRLPRSRRWEVCMEIMRHRQLDGWSSPGQLLCPFSPPPTCVTGSPGAVVIHSVDSTCAGPPGGGQKDAPEGGRGALGTAGSSSWRK